MENYIGRLLDNRYEILEVIGTGGMAVVYKAKCHRLNRLVAVKILKDEYSKDEEFRRRFQAESQSVAMLSHPNIVSVYDVSSAGSIDYIVMELIDGITLRQYMEKKTVLNWRETLHFSMQIAKALEHAHSRGIIHRDIKPHNIMVLKNGSVKVTDFGIARMSSSQNTLTREALGSVHYISPEQAKGSRVDTRSDIYSLGVVMYEMLCGRPPYDGETPVSVAIQHINATAVPPRSINPTIPVGLEQITMHAMCADLDQRYESATQMLYDLEEFRKNPQIVFSFGLDQQLPQTRAPQQPQRPRSPAESYAGQNHRQQPQRPNPNTPEARRRAEERRRAREEAERERKKRRNTVVAISTVAVILLALVIILVASSCSGQTELVEVPSFVGKVYEDLNPAAYPDLKIVLAESVFDEEVPEGEVIGQSPDAGDQVRPGTEVALTVSAGPKTDDMPNLEGQLKSNAEKLLDMLELNLTILYEEEYSDDIDEGRVTRTDPAAGTTLQEGQAVTVYISKGPETILVPMPNLLGKTEAEAIAALEELKLKYTINRVYDDDVDAGKVISQSVNAGDEVKEGTTVALTISLGPETVTVQVPSVLGYTEADAIQALVNAGLTYSTNTAYSNTVPQGQVISQSINGGQQVDEGTTVTLTISLGPEPQPEPEPEPTPTPNPDEGDEDLPVLPTLP